MTMISQGAEANVYTTTFCGRACVLKRRMRKAYRHPTLDVALQTTRTISVCEKKKKKIKSITCSITCFTLFLFYK
jgi:TP53 regulating kinase-like protein